MRSNSDDQTRRFVYKPRDPKLIERQATETQSRFLRTNKPEFPRYKSRTGLNQIRFMPPTWEGYDHYSYPIQVHKQVGPDEQSFLCLRMLGKPCPGCEERTRLARAGEKDAANKLRPQDDHVAWIIDRKNIDSSGPELFFFSGKTYREYNMGAIDRISGEMLDIDDPENGYDVTFHFDNRPYEARQVVRRSSPLHPDSRKEQEWLDYIMDHPVPTTLHFCSYEQALEAIEGGVPQHEPEEPKPLRSRSLRDEVYAGETDDPRVVYEEETDDPRVVYEEERERPPRGEIKEQRARYGDERDEGHLLDNREPEERPRTRLREEAPRDVEPSREVNPSRQARSNLRELRPPSQRPSLRERER